MFKRLFSLILAALLLAACDVINQNAALRDQLASLNLVIRDTATAVAQLRNQLPQAVWVQLYRVEAVDENGNTATLYDAGSNGEAVNLVSPSDVARLLDSVTLPPGRYIRINLVLATTVTVIENDGTSRDYTVPNTTPPDFSLPIDFKQPLDLAGGDIRTLALNIDAQKLLDLPAANDTTLALDDILSVEDTLPDQLPGIEARLDGTVVSVDVANATFLLRRDGKPQVRVILHSLAVIIDEDTNQPLTLDEMRAGDEVEVFGRFDPLNLLLEAVAVSVDPQQVARGSAEDVNGKRVEVEGRLQNVNTDAGTADLLVFEASFNPGAATITVIDLNNATYRHGSANQLNDGLEVEIKGIWNGTALDADLVSIEGALPNPNATGTARPFELKGTISGWDMQTQQLTLQISEVEYSSAVNPGDTVTVDLSQGWFKRGGPACLGTSDREVELKVVETDTGYQATVIEVDDCRAQPGDYLPNYDDHDGDHAGHDSGRNGSDDMGSSHDDMDGSGNDDGTPMTSPSGGRYGDGHDSDMDGGMPGNGGRSSDRDHDDRGGMNGNRADDHRNDD